MESDIGGVKRVGWGVELMRYAVGKKVGMKGWSSIGRGR